MPFFLTPLNPSAVRFPQTFSFQPFLSRPARSQVLFFPRPPPPQHIHLLYPLDMTVTVRLVFHHWTSSPGVSYCPARARQYHPPPRQTFLLSTFDHVTKESCLRRLAGFFDLPPEKTTRKHTVIFLNFSFPLPLLSTPSGTGEGIAVFFPLTRGHHLVLADPPPKNALSTSFDFFFTELGLPPTLFGHIFIPRAPGR